MKAETWENKIKKSAEEAGTYKPCFSSVIKTLASILEERDKAYEAYRDDGRQMVEYTNKGGATNLKASPYFDLWHKLNEQALKYWSELGLTPAGMKKITGEAGKKEDEPKGLAAALMSLEG